MPITYSVNMQLLDWFAGQALVGLLSQVDHTESGLVCPHWESGEETSLAKRAYRSADAMLAERAKRLDKTPVKE